MMISVFDIIENIVELEGCPGTACLALMTLTLTFLNESFKMALLLIM